MIGKNSSSRTFYGSSPGQNLADVVARLSVDDLRLILKDDIVSLVEALAHPEDRISVMRGITTDMLRDRANDLLARSDIRTICLNATSLEKLSELAGRVGAANVDALRTMDPAQNAETWWSFLGFFGIDGRGAAPFTVEPERESVRPEFGMFPHQRRAADRVFDAIRDGHGRVVLHMPTGSGKTRTAMHVVSRFLTAMEPSVIVWLAASTELLEQAADAFQNAWARLGNRKIDILRFWGDYAPDLSGKSDCLIVAGLQKMHALKERNHIGVLQLSKSVRLVVIDEAHQAIAPTYRETINLLAETGTNNALVGLTATPGRTWSDIAVDERLSDFFGERKVMLEVEGWDDPVSFLMDQGYLARPEFRRLEIEPISELKPHFSKADVSEDYDLALLESLAGQVERNVAIINEIGRLIDEGHRRIILFGASVRHTELLAVALSAFKIDGRVVTGNTAASTRARIINEFRGYSSKPMVICNFGVLTTGFDAPNTSAAVIARPTKSLVLFSQMVGRATRGLKAGGNETCVISTVVDVDLPGFGDISEAFTNWEDVWRDPH